MAGMPDYGSDSAVFITFLSLQILFEAYVCARGRCKQLVCQSPLDPGRCCCDPEVSRKVFCHIRAEPFQVFPVVFSTVSSCARTAKPANSTCSWPRHRQNTSQLTRRGSGRRGLCWRAVEPEHCREFFAIQR